MRSSLKNPFNCPVCWSERVMLVAGWYREYLGGDIKGKTRHKCLACGKEYSWQRE